MIEKILNHLGLWDLKVRPHKVKPSSVTVPIGDPDSRVPFSAPPSIQTELPDGYPQDFKTARGDTVAISAIYHLFPILQKSRDLIFIYSPGIPDFNP